MSTEYQQKEAEKIKNHLMGKTIKEVKINLGLYNQTNSIVLTFDDGTIDLENPIDVI